jgi:hypothetical protein
MNPEELAKKGSEHAHQTAIFAWRNMALMHGIAAAYDMKCYDSQEYAMSAYGTHDRVDDFETIIAIPNGGARHKAVAAKMKAEGQKKGVSDIFWPQPVGTKHGLWIELKPDSKKPMKKEQVEWLEKMNNKLYVGVRCDGWQQAVATLTAYMDGNYG